MPPDEIQKSCEGINILGECDKDPFGDVSQGGINLDIDPLGGVSACAGEGEGVLPSGNATSNDGPVDARDGPVAVLDGLMPMGPALGLQMSAVPRCRLCHGPLDPLEKGVKAFRKDDTFQCKQCCCKWSGLSREFGEWPTDDFEVCTEEEQLHFWQSTSTSIKSLRQSIVNILIKRRIETMRNKRGGTFLPIEVLGRLGYDK